MRPPSIPKLERENDPALPQAHPLPSKNAIESMTRPPTSRAAALVFALLVLATLGAFAWSQRAKREPLVLDRVSFVAVPIPSSGKRVHSFVPTGECFYSRMRIRFRTTVSNRGTIQVIRPGGATVLTLARDEFLKRYRFHTYFWDGRQRGSGIARPGRYKLRIRLLDDQRVLVPPGYFFLSPATKGASKRCRLGD